MHLQQTPAMSDKNPSRKEKRKTLKKQKRKQSRTVAAIREREIEESLLNDPAEQRRSQLAAEEAAAAEKALTEFEERERVWIAAAGERMAREEEDERLRNVAREDAYGSETDDQYEYVDEGPAEIIWQGNEIIVKKKRVKVAKKIAEAIPDKEDDDRPTSNPLPPQSSAFASYVQGETVQEMIDSVAQQVPNFGTEQDKAHCPFHLKTGACRFGPRCSRVHFYPDKSCTLLIKNMYNGPGLTCEQDEGLEYTDEEVERSYEEFYEDVHTEFLKFGEIFNFKVCKNSSFHLRGNLYVHYKSLESAILAFNTMNARYYAGKQIICDFVSVTRWKVAICGEYMKSRLKTCSHGSACNFIHCFRNPGGEYEWADWDNPPPRYWIKRMIFLFGTSVESGNDKELESEDYKRHGEPKTKRKPKSNRHQSEKFHYKEKDLNYSSSDGEELNSKKFQHTRHSVTRDHLVKRRARHVSKDKNEQFSENHRSEGLSIEANDGLAKKQRRHEIEDRSSSVRRKTNSESRSHKKHNRKQHENDSDLYRVRNQSMGSKDQFNDKYSSEDVDTDKDDSAAGYRYSSHKRRKYDKHSSQQRRSHLRHEHRCISGEVSDESPGRWKVSKEEFLVEET